MGNVENRVAGEQVVRSVSSEVVGRSVNSVLFRYTPSTMPGLWQRRSGWGGAGKGHVYEGSTLPHSAVVATHSIHKYIHT